MEWVFWISISRRRWFKNLWTTRGANFRDIQILGFIISIGLPWKKQVVDSYTRDYGKNGVNHILRTNKENLKHKFSILIPVCK